LVNSRRNPPYLSFGRSAKMSSNTRFKLALLESSQYGARRRPYVSSNVHQASAPNVIFQYRNCLRLEQLRCQRGRLGDEALKRSPSPLDDSVPLTHKRNSQSASVDELQGIARRMRFQPRSSSIHWRWFRLAKYSLATVA